MIKELPMNKDFENFDEFLRYPPPPTHTIKNPRYIGNPSRHQPYSATFFILMTKMI